MPKQKEEFGRDYARSQIDRQKNPFRKLIKSFYVSRILQHVDGPAVDLGCGAGQILERLPVGSVSCGCGSDQRGRDLDGATPVS